MSTTTTKILIANNSLAATKFIISLTTHNITFLGMVTTHDLHSNQLYVTYLDRYVIVHDYGVDEILRAAAYFQPDYVWPGWGHSSENYVLPRMLRQHGYQFIGPDEHAMRVLGDKIMSNRFAESRGVPCIPYTTDEDEFVWFYRAHAPVLIKSSDSGGGKGIEVVETEEQLVRYLEQRNKMRRVVNESDEVGRVVNEDGEVGRVVHESDEVGRVVNERRSPKEGDEVGKRSPKEGNPEGRFSKNTPNPEGRSPKGSPNIKKCSPVFNTLPIQTETTTDNKSEYSQSTAQMTVLTDLTSTPSTRNDVFMTKIIKNARHIELQMLRDNHNNTILLGTRDCTLQRRHQKIIEEGPAMLSPTMYERMKRCAEVLLHDAGYVGVATVEFLVARPYFYFLEVNTRIQVEHPVTEFNAGVNIPELQLGVAMDKNMGWLKEHVRKCYVDCDRNRNRFDRSDDCSVGNDHERNDHESTDHESNDHERTDRINCKSINGGDYNTNVNTTSSYCQSNSNSNHVIAARITAEDSQFNPQTGRVSVAYLPTPNTLAYFSVLNGQITEQNDSQFGHVFAYGRHRKEAIANLITALMNIKITGIDSPVPRVLDILRSRFFADYDFYTDTLEKLSFRSVNVDDIAYFSVAYFLVSGNERVSFVYNDECFSTRCYVVSEYEVLVELNGTYYKVRMANDGSDKGSDMNSDKGRDGNIINKIDGKGSKNEKVFSTPCDNPNTPINTNNIGNIDNNTGNNSNTGNNIPTPNNNINPTPTISNPINSNSTITATINPTPTISNPINPTPTISNPNNGINTFTFNDHLVTLSTISTNTFRMNNRTTNTFTLHTRTISAPFNGLIVQINDGYIPKDGTLFVIEAMKTRTHIRSKQDLRYTKLCTAGTAVKVGHSILRIDSSTLSCNTAVQFDRNYDEHDLVRWTRMMRALPVDLHTFPCDERIFEYVRVHCVRAMRVVEDVGVDEERCVRIRRDLEGVMVEKGLDEEVVRFYLRLLRMSAALRGDNIEDGEDRGSANEDRSIDDTDEDGEDGVEEVNTNTYVVDEHGVDHSQSCNVQNKFKNKKTRQLKLSAFPSAECPPIEHFPAHSFTHDQLDIKPCACARITCSCTCNRVRATVIRAQHVTDELIVFVKLYGARKYVLYVQHAQRIDEVLHLFAKIVCKDSVRLSTRGYDELFVYCKDVLREYYVDGLRVNVPGDMRVDVVCTGFLYLMYVYLCTIRASMCYVQLFLRDVGDVVNDEGREDGGNDNEDNDSVKNNKDLNNTNNNKDLNNNTNTNINNHGPSHCTFPTEEQLKQFTSGRWTLSYKQSSRIGLQVYVFNINGENVVFVINDRKFKNGSFSYKELVLFHLVNLLCTAYEMARIHFSNNSGARIGIDEEVMNRLVVRECEGELVLYDGLVKDAVKDGGKDKDDGKVNIINDNSKGNIISNNNKDINNNNKGINSNTTNTSNNNKGITNKDTNTINNTTINTDNTSTINTNNTTINTTTNNTTSTINTINVKPLQYITTNDDSGPENLSFSSQASISTIHAYNHTFTLSFITNHSVGIGAYLAVLGKRVIMKRGSVMLLTGYRALNKLNQTEIYHSNEQLGGVGIMCGNNVCQMDVVNEYEGVCEVFRWLRFWMEGKRLRRNCYGKGRIGDGIEDNEMGVEDRIEDNEEGMENSKEGVENRVEDNEEGLEKRIEDSKEGVEDGIENDKKEIKYKIQNGIKNDKDKIEKTLKGQLKEKDSFIDSNNTCSAVPEHVLNCRETVEIIAHGITEYSHAFSSNIKTVRCFIRDMPVGIIYAYENGTCVLDAPSSEKFSTFIDQINAENLNLIIMANFKGFSGGDTDMKNGILKQGSKIIESLKTFKNKIFVYVGCGWQVRGGTFVILDKFINERIRVFVSMHGRIGIMQPSGLSEVKFKDKCRIKVLERNGLVVNDKNLNEFAVKFCELHDHPERMVRKGRVDGMMEIDGLESAIYEYFCGD